MFAVGGRNLQKYADLLRTSSWFQEHKPDLWFKFSWIFVLSWLRLADRILNWLLRWLWFSGQLYCNLNKTTCTFHSRIYNISDQIQIIFSFLQPTWRERGKEVGNKISHVNAYRVPIHSGTINLNQRFLDDKILLLRIAILIIHSFFHELLLNPSWDIYVHEVENWVAVNYEGLALITKICIKLAIKGNILIYFTLVVKFNALVIIRLHLVHEYSGKYIRWF